MGFAPPGYSGANRRQDPSAVVLAVGCGELRTSVPDLAESTVFRYEPAYY